MSMANQFEIIESRLLLSASVKGDALSVRGTDGNDSLTISADAKHITVDDNGVILRFELAQVGRISVNGQSGNDLLKIRDNVRLPTTLQGDEGDDTLWGGVGNDRLIGGLGADHMRGNGGVDTTDYSARINDVNVDLDGPQAPPPPQPPGLGGVDLVGLGYYMELFDINGGSKNDDGEPGERDTNSADIEIAIGGKGNDYLLGGDSYNKLFGRSGNDTLHGGHGGDTLVGGSGDDLMNGGRFRLKSDTVDYSSRTRPIFVSHDTGIAGERGEHDVLTNIHTIRGGSHNDRLSGYALYGGPGNDTLSGADGGASFLYGEEGNDSLHDNNDDYQSIFNGGEGEDTADADMAPRARRPDSCESIERLVGQPRSKFNIEFRFFDKFSGRKSFGRMAAIWSNIILGDIPAEKTDAGWVDDILIDVHYGPLDGRGEMIGLTKITHYRQTSLLPARATITIDSDDIYQVSNDLVFHEIGHALGFGDMWAAKGLVRGARTANARYVGAHALAAYRDLIGDPTIRSVPIDLDGGPETRGLHWNEDYFGSELMTGYVDDDYQVFSAVSLGAMIDLGYEVNDDAYGPFTLKQLPS